MICWIGSYLRLVLDYSFDQPTMFKYNVHLLLSKGMPSESNHEPHTPPTPWLPSSIDATSVPLSPLPASRCKVLLALTLTNYMYITLAKIFEQCYILLPYLIGSAYEPLGEAFV
jgi:hypothetical protein